MAAGAVTVVVVSPGWAAEMLSGAGADVDVTKPVPVNTAVTECSPASPKMCAAVATPSTTGTGAPSGVLPERNWTVPSAGSCAVTVAVSVTG